MSHRFPVQSLLRCAVGAATLAMLGGCTASPSTTPNTVIASDATSSQADTQLVTVSPACETAMVAAGATSDSTAAEPLIVATLSKCSTADEWYAGLRAHPEALGLTVRAKIGVNNMELRNTCYRNERLPVCVDAAKHDRL